VVLVERQKTSKWQAEQLGVSAITVSKWCTNMHQPDLQTLARIAELIGCENAGVDNGLRSAKLAQMNGISNEMQ